MDARDLEPVLEVADVIQIGARNMQNYPLLTEIGRSGRPALLKRGLSATLEELLMAAEYVLKEGNENVMLCERGIRTFETAYRFTLDLTAVPVLKELTHLPVIVDPSHAAGRRALVEPLSLAAAAAGADGIIVEVHPSPTRPSATARSSCAPTTSPTTPRRSSGRRLAGKASLAAPWRRVSVAVVGVGLIGGSIGLAARERLGAEVTRLDPAAAALDAALERGALDARRRVAGRGGRRRRGRLRRRAGRRLPAQVAEALVAAPADCVVTDVGSTKRASSPPSTTALHRRPSARRRRDRGVEHARADLFDGATWYLTPRAARPGILSSACTA